MNEYNKITALYSRLSVGDEDRDGGESNSIVNQKAFLERYAQQQRLTNIRHYIDDDESGRFFDRSAYSRMMEDVENGKIGVCIMKDLTRWGRDYLQVGNAMEVFRRNNVRFIAVNNGIDSDNPDTLEFAPFINIMSEWYAKDISKKVKTGIRTKGASGKPIATEAPYGYMKDPNNKDFWIIDEEAAEVVRLIFRLFIGGKNRNQIAVLMKAVEAGDPEAIAEYERKLALQRERNHRRQQKIKEAREADPAYIAQMEEKERLQREKLLEAERKRTERANRQKKLSRKELKEAAKTDPKAAEEWQALKEKEAVARQRKKEREEERMAADPEYAAMMAERKAEYTRTRTAKRQAEREALVELAKTDEEAAKKLAEMRKYQSQATVRSYQKMKADAEAGDPDAIKRYETTLAKRREEYHRKKGA